MTEQTDRWAEQPSQVSGLHLERPEVLRSLRHYLQAQSQGHHTIDYIEDRDVERRGACLTIFFDRTRQGPHQSDNHQNCFKVGENSVRWPMRIYGLF